MTAYDLIQVARSAWVIGILRLAQRVSGQQKYDVTMRHHLIVIQRARETGFTLGEIKELFFGFRAGTLPSAGWQRLKKRKIVDLDAMLESMRTLLEQQDKCPCTVLEERGKEDLREAVSSMAK